MNVGDRVAFSRAHLRSTRQFAGWAPFAHGTVTQLALASCIHSGLGIVETDEPNARH
jgi:hypothetical protein